MGIIWMYRRCPHWYLYWCSIVNVSDRSLHADTDHLKGLCCFMNGISYAKHIVRLEYCINHAMRLRLIPAHWQWHRRSHTSYDLWLAQLCLSICYRNSVLGHFSINHITTFNQLISFIQSSRNWWSIFHSCLRAMPLPFKSEPKQRWQRYSLIIENRRQKRNEKQNTSFRLNQKK